MVIGWFISVISCLFHTGTIFFHFVLCSGTYICRVYKAIQYINISLKHCWMIQVFPYMKWASKHLSNHVSGKISHIAAFTHYIELYYFQQAFSHSYLNVIKCLSFFFVKWRLFLKMYACSQCDKTIVKPLCFSHDKSDDKNTIDNVNFFGIVHVTLYWLLSSREYVTMICNLWVAFLTRPFRDNWD